MKFTENGLSYELDENNHTAKAIKIINSDEIIYIPKSIKYQNEEYTITVLSQYLTESNKNIKSISFPKDSCLQIIEKNSLSKILISNISIPSSVQRIEEMAFNFSMNLETVEFYPNSQLFSIGNQSFSGTNIFHITIPSSVKIIEEKAFFYCQNLQYVEFFRNSKLKTIEQSAFSGTSIEKIVIPSNVVNLGKEIFLNFSDQKVLSVQFENDLPDIFTTRAEFPD